MIDAEYTGAIVVKLYNHGPEKVRFERGDKITQLVILPIPEIKLVIANSLKDTERGGTTVLGAVENELKYIWDEEYPKIKPGYVTTKDVRQYKSGLRVGQKVKLLVTDEDNPDFRRRPNYIPKTGMIVRISKYTAEVKLPGKKKPEATQIKMLYMWNRGKGETEWAERRKGEKPES